MLVASPEHHTRAAAKSKQMLKQCCRLGQRELALVKVERSLYNRYERRLKHSFHNNLDGEHMCCACGVLDDGAWRRHRTQHMLMLCVETWALRFLP